MEYRPITESKGIGYQEHRRPNVFRQSSGVESDLMANQEMCRCSTEGEKSLSLAVVEYISELDGRNLETLPRSLRGMLVTSVELIYTWQ